MATRMSIASGNFTAAGTWGLVDATSHLTSRANNTALTTSYVASASFTPGAITVSHIAVMCATRSASPTGTMDIQLWNSTDSLQAAQQSINVADIAGVVPEGWICLKLSSPVVLTAGKAYQVRAKTSSSSQVNLYRNATAGNWSRCLVDAATTGAPAAADPLIICGEWTAAGTSNTFTVTHDNTATTSFGGLEVGSKGVWNCGTSASTAYYYKNAGDVQITQDGLFQCGTSGGRMPSTSSFTLDMACTSNVQYGINHRGNSTIRLYGNRYAFPETRLAADASASATSLTVDDSTGWLNGDEIGLASTSRTPSQVETKALTANASGTTLTITALTNAHLGTSPNKAHLINLNRNVKIFGASASFQTYFRSLAGGVSVIDIDSTEFKWFGSSTANNRGLDLQQTTTATCSIIHSVFRNFTVGTAAIIDGAAGVVGIAKTMTDNVWYNVVGAYGDNYVAGNGTKDFRRNIVMNCGTISIGDPVSNWTDCVITCGTATGMTLTESTHRTLANSMDNIEWYCNTGTALNSTSTNWTLFTAPTGWKFRRNASIGWSVAGAVGVKIANASFTSSVTSNIRCTTFMLGTQFTNCTFDGEASFSTADGFRVQGAVDAIFETCAFGNSTAHTTSDITVVAASSTLQPYANIILRATRLVSGTEVSGQQSLPQEKGIFSAKHDNAVGAHKSFKYAGTNSSDSTIFNSSSVSERLTPSTASYKLQSGSRYCAVASGQTVTASVTVRCSVVGDGTDFNGNYPRLIVKRNDAAGITSDTVLATATGSSDGAWQTISGTTAAVGDNTGLEFVVDCDGTTGWVNVDNFRFT